jgi:ribosomal protein S18 acetylase RimI-like enzyme
MIGPHEHRFVGVFKGDELQGFAVGGKSRGALSGFIRRNKYYLVYRMLLTPAVLVTPQGRKAFRSALRVFRRGSGKKTVKPSAASGPPSFGILAIAVAPAFQGKGVGKVLMEEMERVARARGYGRMHLTVRVDNLQATGFYEKLGWLKSSGDSRWAGGMVKSLV